MAVQQTFDFLGHGSLERDSLERDSLEHGAAERQSPQRSSISAAAAREAGDDSRCGTTTTATEPTTKRSPVAQRVDRASDPQNASQQDASQSLLDQLRAQVDCITSPQSSSEPKQTLSTGSEAIDRLLPAGGLRIDTITEWVVEAEGSGAAALSLITAANRLQQTAGPLVVVGPANAFYPPAAVALGIPANRVLWVRPTNHADTVWSIDQALRCSATAAVWSPVAARLDDRDARRFQLAAEIGNTPGFMIRPAAVRGRPTFADIRFHVGSEATTPQAPPHATAESNRSLRITLDRCRGGPIGQSVMVQITDSAHIEPIIVKQQDEPIPLPLAAQLASPKRTAKRRRA